VRRQAAIGHEIIFDLLRDKADGPAQLDVGQALLAQIKNGFKTDMKILSDPSVVHSSESVSWDKVFTSSETGGFPSVQVFSKEFIK
jgi:hypothetical protein